MADSLRRLVNIGTFNVLQDKLERWLNDYYINTCDQNVALGCEIIELNAKVQGQLFKLLNICASEGGLYGGANIIKSRLLPWLGQNFFATGGRVTTDTSLSVLAECAAKDREFNHLQNMYELSLDDLEDDLRSFRNENQDLREELRETKDELNFKLRSSTSEKMMMEAEIRDLKLKLAESEGELKALKTKAGLLNEYHTEIGRLREDISLLTTRKKYLENQSGTDIAINRQNNKRLAEAEDEIVRLRSKAGLVDDYERKLRSLRDEITFSTPSKRITFADDIDLVKSSSSYRYTPKINSPLAIDDPVQRVRSQNLISRFNDMFAQDRLDAMDTLRRYSDDNENNQRILFIALQEAFSSAKQAFRQYKMKVRSNLLKTHYGPETLEEAVQDYINRNTDLYDLPGMVADVIRAMNRNPKIDLGPDATFAVVQPFIREAVKLAWQMSALAHPLDIATATDAELYDDNKYRRSFDSEYTAPLVNHHIWPCLQQGIRVLVKGEANTRRGASLGSPRRSRSPVRSMTPSRARTLSRSVSPRRRPRSISPVRRARSPMRFTRY